jgi:hypothetical protein
MNWPKLASVAKDHNKPCGLRFLLEEVSQLVNPLVGTQDKSKLSSSDFISIVDPSFAVGRDNKTSGETVENMRVVMTAGCQVRINIYSQFHPQCWNPLV